MAEFNIVPVVLCGGAGTRLWPLSRRQSPKQFLPMVAGRSLFEQAILRGLSVCDGQKPLCVTVDPHKYLVRQALSRLGVTADIIVEPVARNTAAALCSAALWLSQQHKDAVMLILPADHILDAGKAWQQTVALGIKAAKSGRWVSLGIQPTSPSTAFGYIQKGCEHSDFEGVFVAEQFSEKPDVQTAETLCAQGWLWNAGISIVQAQTVLDMLKEHALEVFLACEKSMKNSNNVDSFILPKKSAYQQVPNAQIDRSVLEKSDKISVIPFHGKWQDVGTWAAVAGLGEPDNDGNRSQGDVLIEDSRQTFVHSPHRLTVAIGLENIAIVDTEDVLLVAHKDSLGRLGDMVDKLAQNNRSEVDDHTQVSRPWGYYDVKMNKPGFKVKFVSVRPGGVLSSQFHHHRSEHWIVTNGVATVTNGDRQYEVCKDETVSIAKGRVHRLENRTDQALELVEVQIGSYLEEDDIVRLDDVYNRS